MASITIDLEQNPGLRFRVDNFSVPEAARAELEAQMRKNLAFIATLPGFLGHLVFEKTCGPSRFNVATIAVWASAEAQDAAVAQVRAYYQKMGWDLPAMLARWGVEAELGNYRGVG